MKYISGGHSVGVSVIQTLLKMLLMASTTASDYGNCHGVHHFSNLFKIIPLRDSVPIDGIQ